MGACAAKEDDLSDDDSLEPRNVPIIQVPKDEVGSLMTLRTGFDDAWHELEPPINLTLRTMNGSGLLYTPPTL